MAYNIDSNYINQYDGFEGQTIIYDMNNGYPVTSYTKIDSSTNKNYFTTLFSDTSNNRVASPFSQYVWYAPGRFTDSYGYLTGFVDDGNSSGYLATIYLKIKSPNIINSGCVYGIEIPLSTYAYDSQYSGTGAYSDLKGGGSVNTVINYCYYTSETEDYFMDSRFNNLRHAYTAISASEANKIFGTNIFKSNRLTVDIKYEYQRYFLPFETSYMKENATYYVAIQLWRNGDELKDQLCKYGYTVHYLQGSKQATIFMGHVRLNDNTNSDIINNNFAKINYSFASSTGSLANGNCKIRITSSDFDSSKYKYAYLCLGYTYNNTTKTVKFDTTFTNNSSSLPYRYIGQISNKTISLPALESSTDSISNYDYSNIYLIASSVNYYSYINSWNQTIMDNIEADKANVPFPTRWFDYYKYGTTKGEVERKTTIGNFSIGANVNLTSLNTPYTVGGWERAGFSYSASSIKYIPTTLSWDKLNEKTIYEIGINKHNVSFTYNIPSSITMPSSTATANSKKYIVCSYYARNGILDKTLAEEAYEQTSGQNINITASTKLDGSFLQNSPYTGLSIQSWTDDNSNTVYPDPVAILIKTITQDYTFKANFTKNTYNVHFISAFPALDGYLWNTQECQNLGLSGPEENAWQHTQYTKTLKYYDTDFVFPAEPNGLSGMYTLSYEKFTSSHDNIADFIHNYWDTKQNYQPQDSLSLDKYKNDNNSLLYTTSPNNNYIYIHYYRQKHNVCYYESEEQPATFRQSDGSFTSGIPTSERQYGLPFQLLNSVPFKSGYKFKYWKIQGDDTKYYAGTTITDTTLIGAKENIILYAEWEPDGMVHIYRGGKWDMAQPYVYTGAGWKRAIPYIYDKETNSWKQGGS